MQGSLQFDCRDLYIGHACERKPWQIMLSTSRIETIQSLASIFHALAEQRLHCISLAACGVLFAEPIEDFVLEVGERSKKTFIQPKWHAPSRRWRWVSNPYDWDCLHALLTEDKDPLPTHAWHLYLQGMSNHYDDHDGLVVTLSHHEGISMGPCTSRQVRRDDLYRWE